MNTIKCEVTLNRQVYPYNKQLKDGEWAILSMNIMSLLEGEPKTDKYGAITVVGNCPSISYKKTYTLVGKEVENERYGTQYEILYIGQPMDLTDINKQKIFLSYILTETQVKNLYDTLKSPFEAIKNEEIDKLVKVKGIGIKSAYKIIEKYKETIDLSAVYVELSNYNLTKNMVEKLVDRYGSPQIVIEKIKNNPYILITEVDGIGWKTADTMALNNGLSEDSPERIKAYIQYVLEQQSQQGNSYVSPIDLFYDIQENLGGIDNEKLKSSIDELYESKVLWNDKDINNGKTSRVGLTKYFNLEYNIHQELMRILSGNNKFDYNNWESNILELEKEQGWNYTEEQKQGIKKALDEQLCLITGLAGTGKTTITKAVCKILKNKIIKQCALAGRASQRMYEVTKIESFTIHKLLDYDPIEGKFLHDSHNPIEADIIIVDEASMIGGELFLKLLRAIATGTKLLILGDYGQMSSIGTCNVFYDILNSEFIPVVKLTVIHRQAQKSAIITKSIDIRNNNQIINSRHYEGSMTLGELQDLKIDIYSDRNNIMTSIKKHFKEKLLQVPSIMDLQVILPTKMACYDANIELQKIYNPLTKNKPSIEINVSEVKKTYFLQVGDKVINMRNNYKTVNMEGEITPIFNGNIGILKEIDDWDDVVIIDFDNIGEVVLDRKQAEQLRLGYAITCHKFQGSQSNTVLCVIDYGHGSFNLLSSELLYTGITRAEKDCVLIAENKALWKATEINITPEKHTFLNLFLTNQLKIA